MVNPLFCGFADRLTQSDLRLRAFLEQFGGALCSMIVDDGKSVRDADPSTDDAGSRASLKAIVAASPRRCLDAPSLPLSIFAGFELAPQGWSPE
jgi:hypothetical protein